MMRLARRYLLREDRCKNRVGLASSRRPPKSSTSKPSASRNRFVAAPILSHRGQILLGSFADTIEVNRIAFDWRVVRCRGQVQEAPAVLALSSASSLVRARLNNGLAFRGREVSERARPFQLQMTFVCTFSRRLESKDTRKNPSKKRPVELCTNSVPTGVPNM